MAATNDLGSSSPPSARAGGDQGNTEDAASGKRGVAAVERALSILDAFEENNLSLSLSRISQITGLYKSTVLRLIESLEDFGYIRRLQNGEYQLGPSLFHLGMLFQASFNIGDYVVPILQELTRQTQESSSFYIRERHHRLCLYRVESTQILRDHVRPGDKLPLRQGASGQILSTFDLGIEAARRLSDQSKLVAISIGARQPDLAALAAPVFTSGGKLAGALSVSGPRTRLTDEALAKFTTIVLEHARALTARLGGDASVLSATAR